MTNEAAKRSVKSRKTALFWWGLAAVLFTIFPPAYYCVLAWVGGAIAVHKVALAATVVAALILTAVNLFMQIPCHSRIWIVLCGISLCVPNLLELFIMMAVCSVLADICGSMRARTYNRLVAAEELMRCLDE